MERRGGTGTLVPDPTYYIYYRTIGENRPRKCVSCNRLAGGLLNLVPTMLNLVPTMLKVVPTRRGKR